MKKKVLGIGGVSRAGKTTLSSILSHELSGSKYGQIKVIAQDQYALPEDQVPRIKNRVDWEHPDSLDWVQMIADVEQSRNENDLVIVEGIFAYFHPDLNDLYDYAVFLTIRKDIFIERKLEDDRYGEEPEWYIKHIWQSYLKYGLPNIPVVELEGTHMWVVDKVVEQVGL